MQAIVAPAFLLCCAFYVPNSILISNNNTKETKRSSKKRNYLKSWPLFVFGWGAAMAGCVWTRYPASRSALLPLRRPPPLWLLLNYLHFSFLQKISEKLGDDRLAGAGGAAAGGPWRWKVYKFRSEPGHQLAVSHLLTLKAPLTRTMGPGRTLDGLNLCRVLTIMTSISILNTIVG